MTKPKKSAKHAEPEEIGPLNPEGRKPTNPAKDIPVAAPAKGKEKILDAYALALADTDAKQSPVGNLAESVTGGKCTTDRMEALMRLMHTDKRFEIFSKDGLHYVKLTGTSAPVTQKKSAAFMAGMKAHKAKSELTDNPHSASEKQEGMDWEDGWMAAENGQPPSKYEEAKPKPFPVDQEKANEREDQVDDVPGSDAEEADDMGGQEDSDDDSIGGEDDDDLLGDDEDGDDASAKAEPDQSKVETKRTKRETKKPKAEKKQADVIQHPAAAKTIGELVDEAKAKEAAPKFTGKAKIDFPHQISSWVMVLTDGQNPKPGWIKNMHTDKFGKTWYSIVVSGGQIDDIGAERIQQMPDEMVKDYATVGELERLRCLVDAHQRYKDDGEELSKHYYDLLAEEHGIAEQLKKKRQEIEKAMEKMAEHGRADVQLDWRDGTAEAVAAVTSLQVLPNTEKLKTVVVEPEPKREPVEAKSLGLDREQVLESRLYNALKEARETGKIAKVFPVSISGQGPFVMTSFNGDLAELRPLYTPTEWANECQAIYGDPIEDYVEAAPDRLKNGGPGFGMIVKVGRKVFIVGPQSEELLVRLTADTATPEDAVEELAVGKDAAAGR